MSTYSKSYIGRVLDNLNALVNNILYGTVKLVDFYCVSHQYHLHFDLCYIM